MNYSSISLQQLEMEIRCNSIARFPAAMAVRQIQLMQLYLPTYASIYKYMNIVFKWEKRKTKQVLRDANIYAVLEQAFADQPWMLPKFRNQIKGITTTYEVLIPIIWKQVKSVENLTDSERLDSTRAIQKNLEYVYITPQYIGYMVKIYSKHNFETFIHIIKNEVDPIKLAIVLYFFTVVQNFLFDGLNGRELLTLIAQLKEWKLDRVER